MQIEVIGGTISEAEKQAYIDHIMKRSGRTDIKSVRIRLDGEFVDLEWIYSALPFDRVRRVTGYLSELPRFNDGKRAEEHDRVHNGFDDNYFRSYSGLLEG